MRPYITIVNVCLPFFHESNCCVKLCQLLAVFFRRHMSRSEKEIKLMDTVLAVLKQAFDSLAPSNKSSFDDRRVDYINVNEDK